MPDANKSTAPALKPKTIGLILFEQFETLDVFGPVQMFGRLADHQIVAVSQDGRPATSSQGLTTSVHYSFATAPRLDVLLVPGGLGARTEVDNPELLEFLRRRSAEADRVTSVCTGAALLARAGILDGHSATTNKAAFAWVASQSDKVAWQPSARWVEDDRFLTSSGVSAGTDMALALVAHLYDRAAADAIARRAEYVWNDDPDNDPFGIEWSPSDSAD